MNPRAWVIIVSLILTCLPAPSQPPPPLDLPAGIAYNHFLFLRRPAARDGARALQRGGRPRPDTVNGVGNTDTLVMATIRPDGFELRDLYSERNLNIGLNLLGVFGGKAYLVHLRNLLCIDVVTGQCTLIASDVHSYAYADGKLLRADGGDICEYDLRLEAWREITTVPNWPQGTDVGLSPDCRWLALFAWREPPDVAPGYQLNVVDLEQRTVSQIGEPVRYDPSPLASDLAWNPPFAWLNETMLLFVRSAIPERTAEPVNRVAIADVGTGEVRDIAAVPGSAARTVGTEFLPARPGALPTLQVLQGPPLGGQYVVDIEAGQLVESDSIGGDFHVQQREGTHELYHGQTLLAQSDGPIHAAVSPGLEQVAWTTGRPDSAVWFYHVDDGFVRTVAEGRFGDCLLWFDEEALGPLERPARLAAEWRPFEHRAGGPYPDPQPPETREDIWYYGEDISDYLGFTISCDKETYETYRLHEPVLLTLTVANRGDLDLTVACPRIDERVVELAMDYPGGRKLMDGFWGSDEINPIEYVALEPGASVTSTATVEVARPGTYSIRAEYRDNQISADERIEFYGRLTADPVEFTVDATPDDEELLKTKMERLLAALRAQQARAPAWNAWLPAVDDIADVGEQAGPYLLAALEQEQDAGATRKLYLLLNQIASPDALPVYQDALTSEDSKVQKLAVAGLYELCAAETVVKQEALEALLEVVSRQFAGDLRAEAARHLARIHDPAVKATLERLVIEGDPDIIPAAAGYVAAWEEMDLADWLAAVDREPTQTRVAAACEIITELRETWHREDPPDLADFTWESISANATELAAFREVVESWRRWAQDHPRFSETYFAAYWEHWAK